MKPRGKKSERGWGKLTTVRQSHQKGICFVLEPGCFLRRKGGDEGGAKEKKEGKMAAGDEKGVGGSDDNGERGGPDVISVFSILRN